MSNTKTLPDLMPSATPSEADIAAWQSLPRDEQLRRLQLELSHADACRASSRTMTDVWAAIKARRASLNRG